MKLLLELSYLKEACNLSTNIDEKQFKIHLKEAQEELEGLLGPEFYAEIEDQYAVGGSSFSDDNDALYENYIKDYLAWGTYHDYLGFSQRASTPTGERQFEDENSTILDDVKLFSFEKNVRKKYVDKKFRMINFLRLQRDKDPTKYPLWEDKCINEMSFAISSVGRNSTKDNLISVDKTIKRNE